MLHTPSASNNATSVDSGLQALSAIAAYYRIGADPGRLARELALGDRAADEMDLIRAARLVGMKARLVAGGAERLERLPRPAIVHLDNGAFQILGGRVTSGFDRIVDPVSHVATEISPDDLVSRTGGRVLLIARRLGGAR